MLSTVFRIQVFVSDRRAGRQGLGRIAVKSRTQRLRHAFSLMEVMIATAVLAASGAALFALIGQASQFGRRASERVEALEAAENALHDFLAGVDESTGELPSIGLDSREPAYAVEIETMPLEVSAMSDTASMASSPFNAGAQTNFGVGADAQAVANQSQMRRVIVSVYAQGSELAGGRGDDKVPLVRLVVLARVTSKLSESNTPQMDDGAMEANQELTP